MRGKALISIAFILGLFAGCSKEDGDPSSNFSENIRFYLIANVNGLPIEINAGEDNYYLATDYSFADSIVTMKGILSQSENRPQNTFEIKIRGGEASSDLSQFNAYNTLQNGYFPIRDASNVKKVPNQYVMTFFPDSGITSSNYSWDFPDGPDYGPYITRIVDTTTHPRYKASLTTTLGVCNSKTSKVINLYNECDAELYLDFISPLVAEASISAKSGLITEVKWFVNGVESYSGEIATANFSSPGAYEIMAEINFSGGCTQTITKNVNLTGTVTPLCDSRFHYTKQPRTEYDLLQKGTVELIYYDESGDKYTSHYSDTRGSFEMKALGVYNNNDNGQKTARFFFHANAILKNSSGSTIQLTDAFGNFAVAHP